jgi:hypothetical protein
MALIAVIFAALIVIAVTPNLSVLGISQTTMGTDASGNPIWIILMQSGSYSEDVKVFNAGTEIGNNNVLTQRVALSLDYDPPVGQAQFSTSNRQPLQCYDLASFSWKSLGIDNYPYTSPDNPKILQTATVKVTIGNTEKFNEKISLTDGTVSFNENGIVLSPQYQAYQQNPTLIFKGTSVVTFTDGSSYLLDKSDWQSIIAKNYPKASFNGDLTSLPQTIWFNIAANTCPLGGASEKYNVVSSDIRNAGATAPSQSMGGIFTYSAGNLQFDKNSGVLTLPASNAVSNVFTLRIPRQVGDVVVWNPKFLQPEVTSLTIDGKVDDLAKATAQICNRGTNIGYIDVYASAQNGGFSLNPSTVAVKFNGQECHDVNFYLTKTADSFSGTLKVRASSGDFNSEKTLAVETTARDVAPPPPVDKCVQYPELCKQGTNETLPQSTCYPIVQKQTIEFVSPFLGFFGMGDKISNCNWDFVNIGLILIGVGVVAFLYGDAKNKPLYQEYAKYIVLFGVALFFAFTFFESTFLKYLGGNGIVIIAALLILGYIYVQTLKAGSKLIPF